MNFEISKVSRIIEIGEGSRVELDFIDILGEQEGVMCVCWLKIERLKHIRLDHSG